MTARPTDEEIAELPTLRAANERRQAEWDADNQISLAYRGNELAGEVGEACNIIKKIERERIGIRGSRATKSQLADELADVVICADLIAMSEGIDLLGRAVPNKFNATSEKYGLATRLLALVTQEGGEANSADARVPRQDKSPPARSSDAPERALARQIVNLASPYMSEAGFQQFNAEALEIIGFEKTGESVPEGMETTGKRLNALNRCLAESDRLSIALEEALAEIARLKTAVLEWGDAAHRQAAEVARLTAALAEARELLRRMDAGEPAAHMEPLSQTDLIDIIRKGGP